MKILFLGDVNGSPGRRIIKERLRALRDELGVAAVVANGENAAAGNGITVPLAKELIDAGVDVITLGDHAWGQKDLACTIGQCPQILRPANGGVGQSGRGWDVFTTPFARFAVVNLLGRVFMGQADCPFRMVDEILKSVPKDVPVFVDFHAEATSEKISFAYHLDGRATAVVGTHTHVQTSDARLLEKGTAFITDLGMCGPFVSSIGRDLEPVLRKFMTGMPSRFEMAGGPATLEGAVVEFDPATKLATSISAVRVREPLN